MAVNDVTVVLEGCRPVTSDGDAVTTGPGEIAHMPKGTGVTTRSHEEGALTARVT